MLHILEDPSSKILSIPFHPVLLFRSVINALFQLQVCKDVKN